MPLAMISWAGYLARSSPSSRIWPVCGLTRPLIELRVVLLPAPLPPMRATISPCADLEADPAQGVDAAVVRVDVLDREDRRRGRVHQASVPARRRRPVGRRLVGIASRSRSAPRRPGGLGGGVASEIGLDDARILLDLLRRPLGDLAAVVEDGDLLGDAHDHPHLVLDEQDRDAQVAAQLAEEVGHLERLGRVHPGGRFVEQEQAWLVGQGAGDLQPALVAVRQLHGQAVAATLEPDEVEQPQGLDVAPPSPRGAGPACG